MASCCIGLRNTERKRKYSEGNRRVSLPFGLAMRRILAVYVK